MQNTLTFLTINGRKIYFTELLDQSFRETVPLDGYEDKTLEFCSRWLNGAQEVTVHTSGSTGIPKPIVLKRTQLEASAKLTCEFFQLQKGDKVLVCLNTGFIGGLMMLVRGLMCELEMTIKDPVANPLELFDPEEIQFDFLSLVPYQLEAILNSDAQTQRHLKGLKAILLGGAALPPNLEQQVQQLAVPVYNSYGMTETCSHVALRKVNGTDSSTLFTALPGVELSLDARGCLCISGPMTGGETIVTNDLTELHASDQFRLLGRADEVINSGGVKIHPVFIEPTVAQVLEQLQVNTRFFIIGLPHPRLGQEVTLVLETNHIDAGLKDEILNKLNQQLPKFEAPRSVICLAPFPETLSGKIDKRKATEQLI